MTTYEYQTESGEIIEREFPFGEAPKYVTVDGKKAHRYYGASTIVPEYMKATSEHAIQHYDRRDWNARKYF